MCVHFLDVLVECSFSFHIFVLDFTGATQAVEEIPWSKSCWRTNEPHLLDCKWFLFERQWICWYIWPCYTVYILFYFFNTFVMPNNQSLSCYISCRTNRWNMIKVNILKLQFWLSTRKKRGNRWNKGNVPFILRNVIPVCVLFLLCSCASWFIGHC